MSIFWKSKIWSYVKLIWFDLGHMLCYVIHTGSYGTGTYRMYDWLTFILIY
jgi:hypothetical protein